MSAVLYKGKTGITTLVVRMLLKRVLARAAAKTFLPFVGVIVNAAWNALVCHKVLREARIVAIGPSAVVDTLDNLFQGMNVEYELRVFLWRVVAVSIVKKHCRHPNSEVIVRHFFRRFGRVRVEDVDDEEAVCTQSVTNQSSTCSFTLPLLSSSPFFLRLTNSFNF
jgi:hypothetical protein